MNDRGGIEKCLLGAFCNKALFSKLFVSAYRFCVLTANKVSGSGGIRTHAIEMTGALNQRLRPLGHATVEKMTDGFFDI